MIQWEMRSSGNRPDCSVAPQTHRGNCVQLTTITPLSYPMHWAHTRQAYYLDQPVLYRFKLWPSCDNELDPGTPWCIISLPNFNTCLFLYFFCVRCMFAFFRTFVTCILCCILCSSNKEEIKESIYQFLPKSGLLKPVRDGSGISCKKCDFGWYWFDLLCFLSKWILGSMGWYSVTHSRDTKKLNIHVIADNWLVYINQRNLRKMILFPTLSFTLKDTELSLSLSNCHILNLILL